MVSSKCPQVPITHIWLETRSFTASCWRVMLGPHFSVWPRPSPTAILFWVCDVACLRWSLEGATANTCLTKSLINSIGVFGKSISLRNLLTTVKWSVFHQGQGIVVRKGVYLDFPNAPQESVNFTSVWTPPEPDVVNVSCTVCVSLSLTHMIIGNRAGDIVGEQDWTEA